MSHQQEKEEGNCEASFLDRLRKRRHENHPQGETESVLTMTSVLIFFLHECGSDLLQFF